MAKLWGTSTANEQKPNWLTDDEKERCYATSSGWVLKHLDGTEETLVAIAGLSLAGKLTGASITAISFASGSYFNGASKTVRVQFNEKVTVTGIPELIVTGSAVGDITASYSSTNAAGNTLTFSFIVPAGVNVLSVGAQSITLAGGTITETDVTPTVNAELAISADVASAAGTKTTA